MPYSLNSLVYSGTDAEFAMTNLQMAGWMWGLYMVDHVSIGDRLIFTKLVGVGIKGRARMDPSAVLNPGADCEIAILREQIRKGIET